MIKNGMWDIFHIADPQNAAKSWNLFTNNSRFNTSYIKRYIKELRKDKSDRTLYPP